MKRLLIEIHKWPQNCPNIKYSLKNINFFPLRYLERDKPILFYLINFVAVTYLGFPENLLSIFDSCELLI